ncbi:recombinase family protein [Streptomyces celluloflavus]|uniref:recombinase family protein n=1 Tax=Streptomyces celluloflavus TaxID=58344 RepID=UPI0037A5BE93
MCACPSKWPRPPTGSSRGRSGRLVGSACRTGGGRPSLRPHPRPCAPRGTGDPRSRRPAPRSRVEAGPRARRRARAPRGAADPDRGTPVRRSTARQELASQLEALHRAECHKGFTEQISTRVKVRPELAKALASARQFKEAAPDTPVILTVHELKRLAGNAAELMKTSRCGLRSPRLRGHGRR